MATKKSETIDTQAMNICEKLAKMRVEFLNANIKKSGVNDHAEFTYFELKDIVPTATELFTKYNCLFVISFPDGKAQGKLINLDDPRGDFVMVEFPTRSISEPAKFRMNEIQGLGAEITYMRRYLYFLLLDIIQADEIDGEPTPAPKPTAPPTPIERAEIKEKITDKEGQATQLQIDGLKTALKKLREVDPEQDGFIQEIALKTNSFTNITKTACEELTVKIGEMIKAVQGG